MAKPIENNTASLESVIEKIDSVSNEVYEQSDLIAQVKSALQGKVANSGVELPTLTNPATAADTLAGKEFIDATGKKKIGSMANNGTISEFVDGLETKTVAIPEGYTLGGTVMVDDTVDTIADEQAGLLEQIQTALQGKAAAGGEVETCTVTYNFDFSTGNNQPYNVYYRKNGIGQHEQRIANISLASGSFEADINSIVVFTGLSLYASRLDYFSMTSGEKIYVNIYTIAVQLASEDCNMEVM